MNYCRTACSTRMLWSGCAMVAMLYGCLQPEDIADEALAADDVIDDFVNPKAAQGLSGPCSATQWVTINAALNSAERLIPDSYPTATKKLGISDELTLFTRSFGNASQDTVSRALQGYARIKQGLRRITYNCYQSCEAHVGATGGDNVITFCPSFFVSRPVEFNAATVVHEAAHAILGIDHGNPPGTKGTENAYSFGGFAYWRSLPPNTSPPIQGSGGWTATGGTSGSASGGTTRPTWGTSTWGSAPSAMNPTSATCRDTIASCSTWATPIGCQNSSVRAGCCRSCTGK